MSFSFPSLFSLSLSKKEKELYIYISLFFFLTSCLPSSTALANGSVASFRSFFARLRAASSSSRISGRIPTASPFRANASPVGDRSTSAAGRRAAASRESRVE